MFTVLKPYLLQLLSSRKRVNQHPEHSYVLGVGYYGDCSHQDEIVDESGSLGQGFLAEVCKAWEAACEPARSAGIRVVNARIGVVLAPQGGALIAFTTLFTRPRRSGREWEAMDELDQLTRCGCRFIIVLLIDLSGAVNLSAPQAVHKC